MLHEYVGPQRHQMLDHTRPTILMLLGVRSIGKTFTWEPVVRTCLNVGRSLSYAGRYQENSSRRSRIHCIREYQPDLLQQLDDGKIDGVPVVKRDEDDSKFEKYRCFYNGVEMTVGKYVFADYDIPDHGVVSLVKTTKRSLRDDWMDRIAA